MSKEDYRRIMAAFRGQTYGSQARSSVADLTDKDRLRDELDTENASWQPAISATEYDEVVDPFEVAFASHPNGQPYS
ncbi:hypothetical protein [Amycolatopsis pithecellobii]|uniref:hypothetical protein n=1 Tax=Amycolatopsis pithecellobii TaxID=664692 RepID=UPI001FE7EB31|nr:hypothetical protein [Amycolatopsis pithecellobii]